MHTAVHSSYDTAPSWNDFADEDAKAFKKRMDAAQGREQPFFDQVVAPGSAIIMTLEANLLTQHGCQLPLKLRLLGRLSSGPSRSAFSAWQGQPRSGDA